MIFIKLITKVVKNIPNLPGGGLVNRAKQNEVFINATIHDLLQLKNIMYILKRHTKKCTFTYTVGNTHSNNDIGAHLAFDIVDNYNGRHHAKCPMR